MHAAGKYGECLVILEALKSAEGSDREQVERQKLVVQLQASGQRSEWHKILDIEKGATEGQVRTSYKKLAQQVHPDKCRCFGAEQAFQILGEAVAAVLGVTEGGFVKEGAEADTHVWWDKWDLSPSKKKRKREEPPPQMTCLQSEEEVLNLRTCPIEELKKEVTHRQAAVLKPEKGSKEASLTASQRQMRVRAARAILNERLAYVDNRPKRTGGFL